eukprot:800556_1
MSVYQSKQYRRPETEAKSNENDIVDDQEADDDDKYHSSVTTNVFVVTTKRIQCDDYKFRGLQKKLLKDGAVIFNGLPEWALNQDEDNEDEFDKMMNNWDYDEDDNKEV